MKRWKPAWRFMPLLAVIALTLSGCGDPQLSALIPQGDVAEEQLDLMLLSLYIMIGVFIVVAIIYTIVLVKFRRKKGDNEIPEQTEGNVTLEILWTTIPIILLLILSVPTVMTTFALDPTEEEIPDDAVRIQVTAHQYWWEFTYEGMEVTTAQDLYIPVGEKVYFDLKSADVIHSFWVPALGGKRDTNTATEGVIWYEANEPGTYYGKCAELCGPSHALMDFKVVALEREEFDAWVTAMKEAEPDPVTDTAVQGQEIFEANCIGCHAVDAAGKSVGPNLTSFGDRETIAGVLEYSEENLKEWIENPQDVKPGATMPQFGTVLSDEEMNALTEYLTGLTVLE